VHACRDRCRNRCQHRSCPRLLRLARRVCVQGQVQEQVPASKFSSAMLRGRIAGSVPKCSSGNASETLLPLLPEPVCSLLAHLVIPRSDPRTQKRRTDERIDLSMPPRAGSMLMHIRCETDGGRRLPALCSLVAARSAAKTVNRDFSPPQKRKQRPLTHVQRMCGSTLEPCVDSAGGRRHTGPGFGEPRRLPHYDLLPPCTVEHCE